MTGAPATSNVFLPLRNLPKADVNANFEMDAGEQKAVEDPPGSGEYPTPTNAASPAPAGWPPVPTCQPDPGRSSPT